MMPFRHAPMVAFPPEWDYRRVCEIIVAAYATALGCLLMVDPNTLSAPHYARLGGPHAAWTIGLVMLTMATAHSWALWLNGRAAWLSRRVRRVACLAHMGVTVYFASEFAIAGVYWATLTMSVIFTMIYLAAHRVCNP